MLICYKCILQKLGRSLKPLVPKYHPDPLGGLGDMYEKMYSTELKPIVALIQFDSWGKPSCPPGVSLGIIFQQLVGQWSSVRI